MAVNHKHSYFNFSPCKGTRKIFKQTPKTKASSRKEHQSKNLIHKVAVLEFIRVERINQAEAQDVCFFLQY